MSSTKPFRAARVATRDGLAVLCCVVFATACGGSSGAGLLPLVDALTRAMGITDGTVASGDIPASNSETASLSAASEPVTFTPGGSSLLALSAQSATEGERVKAIMLQMAGGHSHIVVKKDVALTADPVSLSLNVDLDVHVCDTRCARTYAFSMTQAVKLANDKVSPGTKRDVVLDCRKKGDPARCTAGSDAGSEADAATMVTAMETADITSLTAALTAGLSADHDALCMNCSDPNRVPCYAIVPLGAISCIETALQNATGTPELATALEALVGDVEGVTDACSTCDLAACAPPLLTDPLSTFPTDVESAISDCINL